MRSPWRCAPARDIGLAIVQPAFDPREGVLDERADRRDQSVEPLLLGRQIFLTADTPMADARHHAAFPQFFHPVLAAASAVGVHRFGFIAGQMVEVFVLADVGRVIYIVSDDALAVEAMWAR